MLLETGNFHYLLIIGQKFEKKSFWSEDRILKISRFLEFITHKVFKIRRKILKILYDIT